MGDGVNLAARLESLGKQYGAHILVSAAVEYDARATFWFRRLDRVAVKGKHEGVEIFELLGRRVASSPPPPIVALYGQALDAYFARDFASALTLLTALAHDPPSRVLADRCQVFLTEPPPSDWNGIFVASSK